MKAEDLCSGLNSQPHHCQVYREKTILFFPYLSTSRDDCGPNYRLLRLLPGPLFYLLCLKISSLCAHVLDLPYSFTGDKHTLHRSSLVALQGAGVSYWLCVLPGICDKQGLGTSRQPSSKRVFVIAAEKKIM